LRGYRIQPFAPVEVEFVGTVKGFAAGSRLQALLLLVLVVAVMAVVLRHQRTKSVAGINGLHIMLISAAIDWNEGTYSHFKRVDC
jgi:hypothetical protein